MALDALPPARQFSACQTIISHSASTAPGAASQRRSPRFVILTTRYIEYMPRYTHAMFGLSDNYAVDRIKLAVLPTTIGLLERSASPLLTSVPSSHRLRVLYLQPAEARWLPALNHSWVHVPRYLH